MAKRNFMICEIRKSHNLSCHNCIYYETCPETRDKAKKKERPQKKGAWTDAETSIARDTTKSAKQVAEATGRSVEAVKHYRSHNGIRKNKRNNNENIYQRQN